MTLPPDHDLRLARALRSLDGLSVGDAMGECFFVAESVVAQLVEQRAIPASPWTYTDDTAMALSIVEVLSTHGQIEPDALAAAFARRYAAEPRRGYGGGAHDLLTSLTQGTPWTEAAPALFGGQGSFGNGGAMRAAPLGAYFAGDDPAVIVEQARRSGVVTHAHPDGQAGAIAIALAAAHVTTHHAAPADAMGEPLFRFVLDHTPDSATRDGIARARDIHLSGASLLHGAEVLGTGYRVSSADTVPFCLLCVARFPTSFVESFWATVAGLGDRDTTCAIVGGIVVMHDQAVIPPAWLAAREPIAAALAAR